MEKVKITDQSFYSALSTGVNPAEDARTTSPPIFWLEGRQWEYPPTLLHRPTLNLALQNSPKYAISRSQNKKISGEGALPLESWIKVGSDGAKPRKNFLGRELALTPSVAKVPSKRVLRSFAERKRQATFPETDTEVPIQNFYSASVIARILAYSAVLPSQVVCTPVVCL